MSRKRSALESDPYWYKDAIIYQLHVKAFFDSNNDGIGDFRGLTQKLDYIQDLGVNAVWLLPFYPSPMRDDGYDIADYRNIHPDYGTRRDFRTFVREAHARGIRVITELVVNHTSDQHPWFQAARRAPRHSAKREYYVWSDDDTKFPETRIIFTDTESSNWAWDPVAGAYYWHRFFSHQPDLNHNNPQVVRAVTRVLRFWLEMGVDGLRLDAIPYLCVREGTNNENLPETHQVVKQMRAVVDDHFQDRMLLAEANQWPEDVRDYFGDGDECHMAYHFPLMPRIYMAIAQEDRHPITEIMAQTPEIPESCQWAIFLRNHDELTLEMVTDKERDYMYQIYATDPRMRVNVGIRRRLAPLMDNDNDKIKLMNSLLLSMPGSPIIYYGDEIGMGDNFFLGDRNGVRTPMQWTPDRNAGFSRADPQRLYLPPIMDPLYGYEAVNVEAQSREPASLLNWMKRMLAVRKSFKAFGRGTIEFLSAGNRKIITYLREHSDEALLCVANLSRWPPPVEIDLRRFRGRVPVELMGHSPFPPLGELPYLLTLPGYGFYWFRLADEAEVPPWHEERLPRAELTTLVLFAGWHSLFAESVPETRRTMVDKLRRQVEHMVLPGFVAEQRWFAGKGENIDRAVLESASEWEGGGRTWLLAFVRVELDDGTSQRYFLPLGTAWEDVDGEERIRGLLPYALARVRQRASVGIVYDALAGGEFSEALVEAMRARESVPFDGGRLEFSATGALDEMAGPGPASAAGWRRSAQEGSNSAVVFDDRLFLKIYRRVRDGLNPEMEMGHFLTEVSRCGHVVPLGGGLQHVGPDGVERSLGILQGYLSNQGDAWNWTLDYLERFFVDTVPALSVQEHPADHGQLHAAYLVHLRTLGRRTGELHDALAVAAGDPAFDPEPIATADLHAWRATIGEELEQSGAKLERALETLPEETRALARRVLDHREHLARLVSTLTPTTLEAVKCRYHGDYHLGQVLLREGDFLVIDFEGEPARTLGERRAKHSPLRDVAGMLRSLSYAGAVAVERWCVERPNDRALLCDVADNWERHAREVFLAGYDEGLGDCRVRPAVPAHMDALIELFSLEKALYELRYELDNRPEWSWIPLRGLDALVAG